MFPAAAVSAVVGLRLGQVLAAAHPGRPGPADRRAGPDRRGAAGPVGDRLRQVRQRLLGYMFQRPADNLIPYLTVADTCGWRRGCAAGRRPAPTTAPSCWSFSGWPTAATTGRASSPGASSSGWPLPGPWSATRRWW